MTKNKEKGLEDFAVRLVKGLLGKVETRLQRCMASLNKAVASDDVDEVQSKVKVAMSRLQKGLEALEQVAPKVLHLTRQCADLRKFLAVELQKQEPSEDGEIGVPFPDGWKGISSRKSASQD
jgi:hypothetical protein